MGAASLGVWPPDFHPPRNHNHKAVAVVRSCLVGLSRELRTFRRLKTFTKIVFWKRMESGDFPGLQNRRAASSMSLVGSTPTRFRQALAVQPSS
jgi:hypothetical protein